MADLKGGPPPKVFIRQVKDALENLYDFPSLQRHPLAQVDDTTTKHSRDMGAWRLRRDLIEAIEFLNPGPNVSANTSQMRLYNLLLLHYVEGRTVQEAANGISISERQAHRNLRRGEEHVAAVMWTHQTATSSPKPKVVHLSSVQEEMSRLVIQPRPTEIYPLLHRALEAVKQQATQQKVIFEVETPPEPIAISVDSAVAQQVLINTLSHTVRQAQPGTFQLISKTDQIQLSITLKFITETKWHSTPAIGDVIIQLAHRLGWTIREEDKPGNIRTVTLIMTTHHPIVLVIDDNEGLVKLLDDYLSGHNCQVKSATSGAEGLQLAEELLPNAILLDVMLPEMDGWEVLQWLKNHPKTASIPVIMCSVLNSPELAHSLGVSLFLAKPISRDNVLTALYKLGVL